MKLPIAPVWNKITDDLDSKDFAKRAREFERSLLPKDFVYPRVGQVWVTKQDCEVDYMAWFISPGERPWVISALAPPAKGFPLGPGGTARLSKGERVRVQHVDDAEKPLDVYFIPLRYHELESSIIPEEKRSAADYSHYQLRMKTAPNPLDRLGNERSYFVELFELVVNTGK